MFEIVASTAVHVHGRPGRTPFGFTYALVCLMRPKNKKPALRTVNVAENRGTFIMGGVRGRGGRMRGGGLCEKRGWPRIYACMRISLPVDMAFIPADVVGGGLDRIVSMPCGFAAPCGPSCVWVGFWSWYETPLPLLLPAFISAIECNAANGGPRKLNGKLWGSNIPKH